MALSEKKGIELRVYHCVREKVHVAKEGTKSRKESFIHEPIHKTSSPFYNPEAKEMNVLKNFFPSQPFQFPTKMGQGGKNQGIWGMHKKYLFETLPSNGVIV